MAWNSRWHLLAMGKVSLKLQSCSSWFTNVICSHKGLYTSICWTPTLWHKVETQGLKWLLTLPLGRGKDADSFWTVSTTWQRPWRSIGSITCGFICPSYASEGSCSSAWLYHCVSADSGMVSGREPSEMHRTLSVSFCLPLMTLTAIVLCNLLWWLEEAGKVPKEERSWFQSSIPCSLYYAYNKEMAWNMFIMLSK